ncbi:hypothetical protein VTK73DRAFT_9853 [Phialemonium thermophilum]|uniref:Actin-related protein 6 n=1 Tax=Phialemonium thermophilum TaxID=223376 RepID=A0ABR3XIE6_9PEZI
MAGGRKSRSSGPEPPSKTLILDNGAYTIKAGFVRTAPTDDALITDKDELLPRIIPNCLARDRHRRVYVGSELEQCRDFGEMAFRRPVEKGFVVNWEAEKAIWDHEFFDPGAPLPCDPTETRLVLTEPPNALPALQAHCDQMVFEEYGFASYYRGVGPAFNAYLDIQSIFHTPREENAPVDIPAEAVLVVDTGYSHTTVVPVLQGRPLQPAIRRLDVGGKLLTNYLTRLLSVRHFDLRNDPHTVNEIKEAACYVSRDFAADLEHCWKGPRGDRRRRDEFLAGSAGIAREYVLPDSHTRFHGLLRDYNPATAATRRTAGAAEDVLTLRNERFVVPELLFHPSDVGLAQPGLPDVILESLGAMPPGLWPAMLANIVVVGGSALFEHLVRRLQTEILQRVPDDCVVRVARPADPIVSTWSGAASMVRNRPDHVERLSVSKQEYEEFGAGWVTRKFAAGLGVD